MRVRVSRTWNFLDSEGNMGMRHTRRRSRRIIAIALCVLALTTVVVVVQGNGSAKPARRYRGLLGDRSEKIKRDGDRTLLWASGPLKTAPESTEQQWYDFTDAGIPAAELQFGIGKDRIRAIDDPLFVPPDDPRLLEIGGSPYRSEEKPKSNDDIRVIGYVVGREVRAYPVALLDRHELVNDRVGGKPVTVGW